MVSGARCRYFGQVPRETVGAHRHVQRNFRQWRQDERHGDGSLRVFQMLQQRLQRRRDRGTAVVHVAGDEHGGQAPDGTAQHVPGRDEHADARPVPEDSQHVLAAVRPQDVSGTGRPEVQSTKKLCGHQARACRERNAGRHRGPGRPEQDHRRADRGPFARRGQARHADQGAPDVRRPGSDDPWAVGVRHRSHEHGRN